jgi:hypothetical protein
VFESAVDGFIKTILSLADVISGLR